MIGKIFVGCVLLAVAVSAGQQHPTALLTQFNEWSLKFKKSYDSVDAFDHAINNFAASIARVAKNNARTGGNFYGLTKFSDLSPAEFKAKYLRASHANKKGSYQKRFNHAIAKPSTAAEIAAAPATWDWRDRSPAVVSAVKDQGQCGSCWAFSATENIESMWALAGNDLPTLAPEQIVDCDTVDQGCNGGDTPTAFEYVTQAGGLETEGAYPYTAGNTGEGGNCQADPSQFVAKIQNFSWVIPECTSGSCNSQNKAQVQTKLASVAPFSICVYAEPWQDYTGGIFNDGTCSHDAASLDHCVQLVGYDNNQGYWTVRNSWNTDWGEAGYIRVSSKEANGNLCGILDEVNYANVASSAPAKPHHHHH